MLNRSPTRALSKQTPYESWTGNKPHLENLGIFGCFAHMNIPGIHVKKLDDRSKHVVHLGKEPGTKAYRLFDPNTGAILVSRDVVFEEEKGWSWDVSEVDNTHTKYIHSNWCSIKPTSK